MSHKASEMPRVDKVVFRDPNPEWCIIKYMSNNGPIHVIRHGCTTLQYVGGFNEVAFIYRYHIETMKHECQYCHTVAPEAIQAVFMFLVME